jgi:hypothetical protein
MGNLKEFKELIERYENITLTEIKEKWAFVQNEYDMDIHAHPVANKPKQKYIDLGYFGYSYYREDQYPRYPVVTENGMKWLTKFLFPQTTGDGKLTLIEYKINLALNAIGIMMENMLVSKSGSQNTPEQNKIIVDKMRTICAEIKNLNNDDSSIPNPQQLQMKLDTY